MLFTKDVRVAVVDTRNFSPQRRVSGSMNCGRGTSCRFPKSAPIVIPMTGATAVAEYDMVKAE